MDGCLFIHQGVVLRVDGSRSRDEVQSTLGIALLGVTESQVPDRIGVLGIDLNALIGQRYRLIVSSCSLGVLARPSVGVSEIQANVAVVRNHGGGLFQSGGGFVEEAEEVIGRAEIGVKSGPGLEIDSLLKLR